MEQRLPKRSEVPEQLTWRLEDIYETEDAWAFTKACRVRKKGG